MGKTVAALSFPKPYLMDLDNKMPTIAHKHYPDKDIAYENFENILDVSDRLANFMDNGCPYETIILDSYSTLANLVVETSAAIKGESVPQLFRNAKAGQYNKKLPITFMSVEYYGNEERFCEYTLSLLKRLHIKNGINVIVIVHVTPIEQYNILTGTKTVTRPVVSKGKKVAAILPVPFDNVWLFGYKKAGPYSTESPRRMCYTVPYGDDEGRCSIRGIPEEMDITDVSLYDQIGYLLRKSYVDSSLTGAAIR
jgi:hypothetical protein